jgi:hypothetical protein
MRSLAQPRVLLGASYAAVATTVLCYPRLAMWLDRPYATMFLCAMVLWTTFVLWAFVLAWQPEYAHRPVFNFACPGWIWATAAAYGILGAFALHFLMDPQLRVTTPRDYPADWHAWIAMTLFTLAMDPLFLCFAPYAFFMRLLRKPDASLALTVMFGLFVQYLKMNSSRPLPSLSLIVGLALVHVVGGFASVYFYVKGGVLPVWAAIFLLELRHACDLLAKH